jgi:ABC-2 type transport system permease protein
MTTKLITNRPTSERQLSPNAQRTGSMLNLLLAQIRAEFIQAWRVPEFLIGIAVIPTILFSMFGLPNSASVLPDGTRIVTLMMASFSAYGILSLCIFTFGVDIAQERGRGWMKLMRATPLPSWVYFVGKIVMAILFAVITLLLLFAVAIFLGNVRLGFTQWLSTFVALLLGGLAFCTLGFALAYWVKPRAASAIANLVFLPLSFLSGFFFPLNQLPEFLQDLAPYLPTFHYGQLVWQSVGHPNDITRFTGQVSGGMLEHVLWLLGTFVVFGVLALWGYQKDKSQQFG